MTFEERVKIAGPMLAQFLERFSPPKGMSETAQVETIKSITEAFVRKLPVTNAEHFRGCIERTFTAVLDSHETYAWPKQSQFVDNLDYGGAKTERKAQETYKYDPAVAASNCMKNMKPVGEHWIWRNHMRLKDVPRETLEEYREHSVASYSEVYGADAGPVMAGKYGAHVLAYFPNQTKTALGM